MHNGNKLLSAKHVAQEHARRHERHACARREQPCCGPAAGAVSAAAACGGGGGCDSAGEGGALGARGLVGGEDDGELLAADVEPAGVELCARGVLALDEADRGVPLVELAGLVRLQVDARDVAKHGKQVAHVLRRQHARDVAHEHAVQRRRAVRVPGPVAVLLGE